MILEALKNLIILLIALPFIYIVVDVFIDIFKRMSGFYQKKAKPVLISIFSSLFEF